MRQEVTESSLVLFVFLVLYWLTQRDGPGGLINLGDTIKWQFLWKYEGLPHSTGYPLYLILSKAFGNTLAFLPDWQRINLISIISGAAAIALFYLTQRAILHAGRLQAALFSLILGCSFTYWSQSTEAEVYTLNALLLSMVVLAFLMYRETRRDSFFVFGCAIYALSFGNHLSMICLAPALVFLVLNANPQILKSPRHIAIAALCAAIGASQYAYTWYLAQGSDPYLEWVGSKPPFGLFLRYITGQQFTYDWHAPLHPYGIWQLLKALCFDLSPVALLIAVLFAPAAWRNLRKRDGLSWFLFIGGFSYVLFCTSYEIFDIRIYYLPAFMLFGLWLSHLMVISRDLPRMVWPCLMVQAAIVPVLGNMQLHRNTANHYDNIRYLLAAMPARSTLVPISCYGIQVARYMLSNGAAHVLNDRDASADAFVGDVVVGGGAEMFYTHPDVAGRRLRGVINGIDISMAKRLSEGITISTLMEKYGPDATVILLTHGKVSGLGHKGGAALFSSQDATTLRKLGINPDDLRFRKQFAAVIDHGAVVMRKNSWLWLREKLLAGGNKLEIGSIGWWYTIEHSSIRVNGKDHSRHWPGLNVVVIHPALGIRYYVYSPEDRLLIEPETYAAWQCPASGACRRKQLND